MPTTQLQRMMFLQGQLCFFCNRTIPKSEASVEHLIPASQGGPDHPDNLVACCKTLNALFGSMNVKEKIRAILKQNGKFVCPNQQTQPQTHQTPAQPAKTNGTDAKVPANQGKPWTPEEEQRLIDGFDAQVSIPELAKAHQRGLGGVQGRLTKLGKMAADQYKTYPPESK